MVGVQTPDRQISVCVHALPSPQLVPSAFCGLEHTPVAGLQTPATWHWSEAAHVTGLVPVQTPAWHVSVWVQAFPSPQLVPFAFCGLEHAPVAGLQTPASWHWSLAVQDTGFPPVQTPAWHVSVWVHALPSPQLVPSALAGLEHTPEAGLQTPATWH